MDKILKFAIKFQELIRLSYSVFVFNAITPEMRDAMSVSHDAEPFASGANSAVFVNNRNNIVAFSDYDVFYKVAEKLQSLETDVLPAIYDVQKFVTSSEEEGSFSLGADYIYAVEMEQLKMLDKEGHIFEKYKKEIFKEGKAPENVSQEEQPIVNAMLDLRSRSERDNIKHIDIWSGNVGWSGSGALKFIDLEAVQFGQLEAEQEKPEEGAVQLGEGEFQIEYEPSSEELGDLPPGGLFG